MATPLPAPEQNPSGSEQNPPGPAPSSRRVLACVLCQQRKVKCDRRFPCANCTRHGATCVPATQPRRRRRRFPERELLDRVRHYEDLLRRNNVRFEPLHKDVKSPVESDDEQQTEAGIADSSSASTPSQTKSACGAKNLWQAMSQGLRDANGGPVFTKTLDHGYASDNLLLGAQDTAVDLAALHPEPVHMFQLWQTYLDNANPVLKVTHTPTLQTRIIEAAGNLGGMAPEMEALLFSIYCMATFSLAPDACEAKFGLSRDHLLARYQSGCRQALLNCGYLHTRDRDCLTALHLYLISARPSTDPRSLSSMLGVAIRIAQRMGLHDESVTGRCGVLEAEMRRRLWWSLVHFDHRISSLAEHPTTVLSPTWDCRVPLNINDSDLRSDMADEPPKTQRGATEAIFAVVRAELGDFVRHSPSHLDFTNPALKPIARPLPGGDDPGAALSRTMEDEYLRFCDPGIPLHFLTIWTARSHVSRSRLIDYYARHPRRFEHPHAGRGAAEGDAAERDAVLLDVFRILEYDTKMCASPLTAGFQWLLQLHFPFPAYIHIVTELRRRPLGPHAQRGWEVMAGNFEARFRHLESSSMPSFVMFANVVLQAWDVLEEALGATGEPVTPPRIVEMIQDALAVAAQRDNKMDEVEQPSSSGGMMMPMPMPMGFGPVSYTGADPGVFPGVFSGMADMYTQAPWGIVNPLSLASMASMCWGPGQG